MNHVSLRLEFATDRFALTGELPVEVNAGNRFYGEDFAKYLCESLPEWKLIYLDEDWGWLVSSERAALPAEKRNSICVYALPEKQQGSNFGNWMLMLHSEHKLPWLKFFARWQKVRFDPQLARALFEVVRGLSTADLKSTEAELDSSEMKGVRFPMSPNPSIERTCNIRLRLLSPAAHVKR